MKLYLDDNRKCPKGWELATTAAQCISILSENLVEALDLDHDLNFEHYGGDYSDGQTGYDVLLWLSDRVIQDPYYPVPTITIHTQSPGGFTRMAQVLGAIKKNSKYLKRIK